MGTTLPNIATMENFIVRIITSQLIIYTTRCLLGFAIGYRLMLSFPEHELFWLLLSIILVISPEGKDSRRLTIERVRSNFIGSFVGLFCVLISEELSFALMLCGITVTSLICHLFRVMNMARVAIVALLIILLQPHLSAIQLTPLLRFATVSAGCLIGLTITVLSSMLLRRLKKHYGIAY